MLRQNFILIARGAPEPIIGQREPLACGALDLVLLVTIVLNTDLGRLRRKLSGLAMLVRGADIPHVMPAQPLEARIDIGW